MSGETAPGTRVELYLCAEPQFGVEHQKQSVIDRLHALERDDKIDEFDISLWGREIRPTGPLEGTDYHTSVLADLREFEEWAEQHDASAARPFKRRTLDSDIVDETYDVISLPTMCIAVYEDGQLRGVYPYGDAEGTHTVRKCLDDLDDADTEPSVSVTDVASERPRRR